MAENLTASALRAQLASGRLAPVYVIVGDDEVEKSALVRDFVALVEPELQPFNVDRFDATIHEPDTVLTAARTLPLMAPRRLVIYTRAEQLFKNRRADGEDGNGEDEAEHDAASLERYVAAPSPETTLLLVGSDINRTTRLGKALAKRAAIVECWGLKDGKKVEGYGIRHTLDRTKVWVQQQVRRAGMTIEPEALEPLLEHAGLEIGVLRGDVERLLLYCAGRTTITVDDVQAVVSGATSLDAWTLTRAIESGNTAQALRQLALSLESGSAPLQVLGQLGWFVRSRLARTYPGRVPEAVEAMLRTDLAMKSSGGDPRVLLERLVVELCGKGSGPVRPGPGVRASGRR